MNRTPVSLPDCAGSRTQCIFNALSPAHTQTTYELPLSTLSFPLIVPPYTTHNLIFNQTSPYQGRAFVNHSVTHLDKRGRNSYQQACSDVISNFHNRTMKVADYNKYRTILPYRLEPPLRRRAAHLVDNEVTDISHSDHGIVSELAIWLINIPLEMSGFTGKENF